MTFRKLLKLVPFIALTFLNLLALQARAGGTSGGGGTAALDPKTGRWVLLDFEAERPDIDYDKYDPVYPADRIEPTPLSFSKGCDESPIQKAPAYQTALGRLASWEALSPAAVRLVHLALDSMHWYFTPYEQDFCYPEQLPFGFGPGRLTGEVRSAVVYTENLGARMSLPVINELGHTSLAGLLIHEALRHTSIAFGNPITEKTLYHLTAKIVLSNPLPGESLDTDEIRQTLGRVTKSTPSSEAQPFDAASESCLSDAMLSELKNASGSRVILACPR